jgi:hypothetical protein
LPRAWIAEATTEWIAVPLPERTRMCTSADVSHASREDGPRPRLADLDNEAPSPRGEPAIRGDEGETRGDEGDPRGDDGTFRGDDGAFRGIFKKCS